MFSLEPRKYCFVEERICPDIGGWAWKRRPNCQEESDELNMLRRILSNHSRSDAEDILRAKLSSDGRFLVSSVRKLIDSPVPCKMTQSGITWCRWKLIVSYGELVLVEFHCVCAIPTWDQHQWPFMSRLCRGCRWSRAYSCQVSVRNWCVSSDLEFVCHCSSYFWHCKGGYHICG